MHDVTGLWMDELACHSLIWYAGTLQLNRARLQLLYIDPIVLSTKHYFMLSLIRHI